MDVALPRIRRATTPALNAMFVDLNSIPQAAIESIEILKDGASTTYGADAVAGVVNIKMRHYYNGAEASVEYGNSTDTDSGLFATSVIFGVGNKTTEIAGALNFYHRNSIANRDRSYSAVPPFLSSNASPYNLQLAVIWPRAAGGQNSKSRPVLTFATHRILQPGRRLPARIFTTRLRVSGPPPVNFLVTTSIRPRFRFPRRSATAAIPISSTRSLKNRWSFTAT